VTVRGARRPIASAVLLLLSAGCGAAAETEAEARDGLAVVATTTVLGDVVSTVVGDAGTVETILPAGADPHSFEPSARQIEALRSADLVVVNGFALEEQLTESLETAQADGAAVFAMAEQVDTIPFAGEHHEDGEEDRAGDDPHFWQDPARMAVAVRALGETLARVGDDLPPEEWAARAEAYAAELDALDAELEQLLADIPEDRRKLVTNHDSFGYFADRYGFETIGTVLPSGDTLAEPSATDLQALAATIEEEQVPAIFAETTQPDRLAEALASEVDVDVEVVELYSDSLGEGEATTYIDMVRTNAERIREALA
jgi:zinc/manganese transport system substrate-binding protein